MNKGAGQQQETSQQRAEVTVAKQQLADWNQRWAPRLKSFAADTTAAGLAGSQTRNHATALTGTDTSAAFAGANDKALQVASVGGAVGSSKQKLGIGEMGNDQATSTSFGSVAADQAVDDSTVQGLRAVTSIAKGEKAETINAIGRNAALSGMQASQDAQESLNNRMGEAGLVGKVLGGAAGLYQARSQAANGTNDIAGVNGGNATDKWLRFGRGGD